MSAGRERRRRPAGFEPALDFSAYSFVPRRGFGFEDEEAIDRSSSSKVALLDWHARGLTSSVYKTESKEAQGRQLCVKVTSLDLLVRPHNAEREIRCLTRLRGSQHVVELLDAFVSCPDPFSTNYEFIMEFLPFDLGSLLDDPATVPPQWTTAAPQALRTAYPTYADLLFGLSSGLVSGLRHMHSSGIAHRDIKPSNILLREDGTPVYADFATAWEQHESESTHSAKSQGYEGDDGHGKLECAIGTGAYRPPEVLFSPADGYDVYKVDVWQLAVTLATFFLPFQTRSETKSRKAPDTLVSGRQQGQYVDKRIRPELGTSAAQAAFWLDPDPEDLADEDEEEFGDLFPSTSAPLARETLFDGDRGEIALASSIFKVLGLPDRQEEWPESASFRPHFDRLSFDRHPPPAPIQTFLPLLPDIRSAVGTVTADVERLDSLLQLLTESLQLSAARRPDTERLAIIIGSSNRA
ncbi:hypothetical protein V8E36_005558 [Tilletia maclaganii]